MPRGALRLQALGLVESGSSIRPENFELPKVAEAMLFGSKMMLLVSDAGLRTHAALSTLTARRDEDVDEAVVCVGKKRTSVCTGNKRCCSLGGRP